MTAAEKTDLFGFLATAEDWISGYRTDRSLPEFTDSADYEEVAVIQDFPVISDLERAVMTCSRCPLGAGRIAVLPGEGPRGKESTPVLVVSLTPCAANGKTLLDKMLGAIKLGRNENSYLTSLVKCTSPQGEKPDKRELAACSSWLDAQIGLLRPILILALGGDSARYLLDTADDLETLRGAFYEYRGIPLLATYHPDDILADENLKRPAWEDLKLFRAELDRIWQNGSK